MNDDREQLEEMTKRYKVLPPDIIELYEYGTVDVVVENIAKNFNFNEEQAELLRMEIDMVLHLFVPQEELVTNIEESLEIDATKANQISEIIESDLFIVVDDILKIASEQLTENTSTNQAEMPTVASTNTNSATETAANSNVVKPLRTFAEDVEISRAHSYGAFRGNDDTTENEEGVYRSSQDDIMKRK